MTEAVWAASRKESRIGELWSPNHFAASCAHLLTMFFNPAALPVCTMHPQKNWILIFNAFIAPILGIAIAKISVKALKQRTIVFKLMESVAVCSLC